MSWDTFKTVADLIEVTSLHRPDPDWRFIDANGHEHRWYVNGQPATTYRPDATYDTPTLVWVKDGEEYWEDDDEPHAVGHLECTQCGQHISPGYTADTTTQHIPGLRRYYINGEEVHPDEYRLRRLSTGLYKTSRVT